MKDVCFIIVLLGIFSLGVVVAGLYWVLSPIAGIAALIFWLAVTYLIWFAKNDDEIVK